MFILLQLIVPKGEPRANDSCSDFFSGQKPLLKEDYEKSIGYRCRNWWTFCSNSSPLRSYSISNDLEKLHKIFESKGFENSMGLYNYLSSIYKRYQVALEHFITKPFRHKRDFYNPKVLWNALKLKTFDSADQMMSKFIPDKDFQQMLSFQTLYIGVSPKKGPSLYNIIPMIELLYGAWVI